MNMCGSDARHRQVRRVQLPPNVAEVERRSSNVDARVERADDAQWPSFLLGGPPRLTQGTQLSLSVPLTGACARRAPTLGTRYPFVCTETQ